MGNSRILEADTILADRYRVRRLLGTGGNGSVYLVYDEKLKKEWAMKQCDNYLESELEVLKRIENPLFPRIVDIILEDKERYLVMDYIRGRSLREIMRSNPAKEEWVWQCAKSIAEALSSLHSMTPPVYYLDCKPDNIILTEQGEIRMVDVGSAVIAGEETEYQKISGTIGYAPGEQRRIEQQKRIDARTDIYSFGKTLYFLLTGTTKEYRDPRGNLNVQIANPHISYDMRSFLERCCHSKPDKRFQSMEELLHHLNHSGQMGRKRKGKIVLEKVLLYSGQLMLAAGCLFSGFQYRAAGGIRYFILCSLLFIVLLLSMRKENIVEYEMKKDIYGCMGRRFLILFLGLYLLGTDGVSYAQDRKGEKEQNSWNTVTIYDEKGRKLLTRQESTLLTEGNLFLELPVSELQKGIHQITVSCQSADGEEKQYQFYYESNSSEKSMQ